MQLLHFVNFIRILKLSTRRASGFSHWMESYGRGTVLDVEATKAQEDQSNYFVVRPEF